MQIVPDMLKGLNKKLISRIKRNRFIFHASRNKFRPN